MVTAIKNAEKKSIHGNGSTGAKEEALKSFTSTTKGKVDAAIKARTESLSSLYSAAAYSFYLGIVHGRWEQANRLFRELPTIDADALRQKFAFRVNDKYAVDGVHDVDASGNEIEAWTKRPTTMIVFLANPATKGEHFSLAKANDGESGEAKRKLIADYRAKIEAASVEDMEAIEWLSRERVISSPSAYDNQAFQRQLKGLLIKAAKATGDNESGITVSTIEAVMRDVGLPKAMKGEIREAYAAESTDRKPETKTPETETKTEEKPAEQQAA